MAAESARAAANAVKDVPAGFMWHLRAFEWQGNLWLDWWSDAPFRDQQGQIRVYSGSFPANPNDNIVTWKWDNEPAPWDTGQRWGTGWACARVAETGPLGGPYVYFIKLVTKEAP